MEPSRLRPDRSSNQRTSLTFDRPVDALTRAIENQPDPIFSDYKMPGLDRIDFMLRLRALTHCRDITVVVVSMIEDPRIRCQTPRGRIGAVIDVFDALTSGVPTNQAGATTPPSTTSRKIAALSSTRFAHKPSSASAIA